MSCPYKYILGIPGQGVHAARFLGLAINDVLMTIAAAFLTSLIFRPTVYNFLGLKTVRRILKPALCAGFKCPRV